MWTGRTSTSITCPPESIHASLEFIWEISADICEHQRRLRVTEIKGYHAHVYYSAATRRIAEGLRGTIIGKFAVEPGAFSDEPRGPHPISQFNIIFEAGEFQK